MKQTYVALLLDSSGSMASIRLPALQSFNNMLTTIREEAASTKLKTTASIFTFATRVETLAHKADVAMLLPVPADKYRPGGGTALFDAVGSAIEDFERLEGKDANFLILAVTDGEENESRHFSGQKLAKKMQELQGRDNWTFAFSVPRGYKNALAHFGIPSDNIKEWEQTTKGAEELGVQNNAALRNYYIGAASASLNNQTFSSAAFYVPVTTDLSKLKAVDVAKLADLSGQYKEFEVKAEAKIEPFVAAKTKRPYALGQAYYQLMKTEKIQPQKAVLLREKKSGKVWGGQEARQLIGLPSNDHARVKPGNHSDYDIFVQSSSTNRILPRGTHVLVTK